MAWLTTLALGQTKTQTHARAFHHLAPAPSPLPLHLSLLLFPLSLPTSDSDATQMQFEPSSSVTTIYASAPLVQRSDGGASASHSQGLGITTSATDADGTERDTGTATGQEHTPETSGVVSPPPSTPTSPELPEISPPDSPTSSAISSFPSESISVSSSFFFSSGAASPRGLYATSSRSYSRDPQDRDDDDNDYDDEEEEEHEFGAPTAGLIIPSLTLPAALRSPTTFGQTLGEVNILLLGPKGSGKTALAEYIVDAEDVVDVSAWEAFSSGGNKAQNTSVGGASDGGGGGGGGKLLRASTDWIEERDAHGLEKFEGTKNVVVVELNGFDRLESTDKVIQNTLKHVHGVFYDIESQISRSPSSPLLYSLLSSSHTTLYTALVYVAPFPLTSQDHKIIRALSTTLPIIPLCLPPLSSQAHPNSNSLLNRHDVHTHIQPIDHTTNDNLASFQPRTISALRAGLFRCPQTLAGLRCDAADRYLRWREVERAYEGKLKSEMNVSEKAMSWNKAEWEVSLSEDYSRHLKAHAHAHATAVDMKTQSLFLCDEFETRDPCYSPLLDPLSVRSVVSALLSRSRSRGNRQNQVHVINRGRRWSVWTWSVAIVSVFCAGVGIGLALSSS